MHSTRACIIKNYRAHGTRIIPDINSDRIEILRAG